MVMGLCVAGQPLNGTASSATAGVTYQWIGPVAVLKYNSEIRLLIIFN